MSFYLVQKEQDWLGSIITMTNLSLLRLHNFLTHPLKFSKPAFYLWKFDFLNTCFWIFIEKTFQNIWNTFQNSSPKLDILYFLSSFSFAITVWRLFCSYMNEFKYSKLVYEVKIYIFYTGFITYKCLNWIWPPNLCY